MRRIKTAHRSNPLSTKIACYGIFDTGNMWAQDWAGVESLVRPFPGTPGVDVTDEMVNQVGL